MGKSMMKGAVLASAVAGLLIGGSALAAQGGSAGSETAKVKCEGVNQCKGKGACASATHDCAGKNACKGKGWLSMTAAECKAKGGTVKD